MTLFKYIAKDATGRTITGKLEVANKNALIEALRKRQLIIISIEKTKEKLTFLSGKKKIKSDDLVIFSRQLATMVGSGIPVVGALGVLGDQIENPTLKDVIEKIRDEVEAGLSLSQALAKFPRIFSPLYINMIKAGESSGMLDDILDRLATYMEKVTALMRKVKSSLTYPAVVVFIALSITIFLVVKVVPTFKGIFAILGGDLPTPTRLLLAFSDFVRKYFLFGLAGLVVFIIVVVRYIKTERGRYRFDRLLLRLPILGPIFRKVSIARFSSTLCTLVRSGVPILASLDIVGKTCGNKVLELAIIKGSKSIKDGRNIAEPLEESKVFPPMVTRMISVGEQTGELEKMLAKIAEFYEEQVDAAVSSLTSIIEPIIIVFLGVVVGSIVLAIFLPIFKITEIIGR